MKLPEFEEHQLLVIQWRDAFHDFESETGVMKYDDYIANTAGFYTGHDEKYLSVAQEILPHHEGYRGASHIPLILIQTINGEKV